MARTMTDVANRPVWVDLSSPDAEASRAYYSQLFGWQVEVNPDPAYGGYGLAKLDGNDVAGIGPKQSPEQPTVWQLYIGMEDAEDLARRVQAAGGAVIAPPFDVGDQGRMAIFQDPAGAVISAWQRQQMGGFHSGGLNSFGWAELNARGLENALPFYEQVFGWSRRTSPMGEGQPPYTEFLMGGESILGAWEMNQMMPAEVPSYWQIYFLVEDVDAALQRATDLGGQAMVPAQDFPGGRFAIVTDPQGAMFGLLRMAAG